MATGEVTPAIGVIGGAGPYAGLDLVRKIFDHTVAGVDQEHLPVALLSMPAAIPDRTGYLLGREKINPAVGIAAIALQLERMGARVAAIACNTAHAAAIFDPVLSTLQEAGSKLKMLHLVDETVRFVQREYAGCRRIGVLCTTGAYRLRLYARPLEEAGYQVVVPTPLTQEEQVHPAIYHPEFGIKARCSPVTPRASEQVRAAVRTLGEAGAEAVILGCTELPLAITEAALHGMPIVDPTAILARAFIRAVAPDRLKRFVAGSSPGQPPE